MQLESGGDVIPFPAVSPREAHAGEQGTFDFYNSKVHRLTYSFFM